MISRISVLIVLLFGLLAIVDLLHPGFAVTHDGQDHIARIANFYQNLSEGILIPRWAENLNWGYGHPILEFLYPFPSYVASLLHFFGFSFVESTKLVFAIAMIASGVGMYLFAQKQWGYTSGIVSGILYMYAPYRFVDLYVRGDIGEHVAFVFIPLALLGMYLVFEKKTLSRFIFASISVALLILSHNAIALMVTPLLIIYMLYLIWLDTWKRKTMIWLFGSIFFGFLLSSFFWVPALLEGQYTLRNIVTKGEYASRFVDFSQLFYGKWSYGTPSMQLGIVYWIVLVASIVLLLRFWKKEKVKRVFLGGLILYTAAAIFLMLPYAQFIWQKVMLLQNFQFPWRFLAVPVVTISLLGGFCVAQISGVKKYVVVVSLCCILLFLSREYFHAKSYAEKPESFFTGIYNSTTDTGESAPVWSVRFMLGRFDKPLEPISGNALVTQEKRFVTMHSYTVSSQGESRLLENTLYFPGWRVTVDGKQVGVEFQDPMYRGLMTFLVPDGTHTVSVAYQESKFRLFGDILSLIGIGGLLFLFLLKRFSK